MQEERRQHVHWLVDLVLDDIERAAKPKNGRRRFATGKKS